MVAQSETLEGRSAQCPIQKAVRLHIGRVVKWLRQRFFGKCILVDQPVKGFLMTQSPGKLFRQFLPVAICLVVCGAFCSLGIAAGKRASGDDAGSHIRTLSASDRKAIFEKVWTDISLHYYDPAFNGVNWKAIRTRYEPNVAAAASDSGFYELIKRMVEELHDAHTRFSTPQEWHNREKHRGVSAGFGIDQVEGKTVVTAVVPDSPAARSGIQPGMVLLRIDDLPVETRLAEVGAAHARNSSERADLLQAFRNILSGPVGSSVKVQLQRADGSTFETTVNRELLPYSLRVQEKSLGSGIAYIRFDEFEAATPRQIRDALRSVHNAPGLIIDLRANGGGTLNSMLQIAGYFLPQRTRFASDRTRDGKPISFLGGLFKIGLELYAGEKGHQLYAGPVAILVRGRTASAAEIFSAGMQEAGRAQVFGTQTCGCVLGIVRNRRVRGGGVLEISEMLWLTPKGRKLEGEGVLPDREVRPSITDIQQKHDATLEAAEKSLRGVAQHARLALPQLSQ
jgi:carboxyl-terminal processing protease